MSVTNNLLHAISDHGNAIASKVITYFGIASIGGGGVLGVANGTAEKVAQAQTFGLPDWAAVVSIVGGLCLIIKNGVDTYYTLKDRRDDVKAQRNLDQLRAAEEYMQDERRKAQAEDNI